jgi:hypothetical protein
MMKTITVTGGNLFEIASRMLGDAELWSAIATASFIEDPWLQGLTRVNVPCASAQVGAAFGAS